MPVKTDYLLDSPILGYAYHKLIVDSSGIPCDYEFIEVNSTFSRITGLNAEKIVGSKVTELIPGIKADTFNWIAAYGEIALKGGERFFEHYSFALERWYKVHVYSHEKGFFTTLFMDITENKKTQETLEGFFTVNLDLLCIADIEGNFIKTNEAWARILGYSTQDLNKRKFLDFVHPDDMKATLDAISQLRFGDDVLNFTNRYRAKDGSWRFIEWRSHPKGALIYASARDVTDRVRAEQSVIEKEANFRAFFESMTDMVLVADFDGKIIYVNTAFTRMLGYSLEDLSSIPVIGLYPAWARSEAEQILQAMLEGKRQYCTLPVERKDGRELPVESRVSKGVWNGSPCVFGIMKDMSMEYEARERFNRLFELNPSMMALSELPERRFVEVNNKFLAVAGKTREEIIGKKLIELDIVLSKESYECSAELIERDGFYRNMELAMMDAQGKKQTMLASADVIEMGSKRYLLLVLTDITDQKSLELELAAEKERLRRILEGTNVGTWEWNVQTGETVFNERWASILGYTLEDLEPISIETWVKLCHPDDLIESDEKMKKHFSGELDYYEHESRMKHKDGHWVWVLDRGKTATWTEDGKPLLVMGTHQDISSRREAQELVISQAALQQILMEIAAEFINAPLGSMDELINNALAQLGLFTGVDRTYIFTYDFAHNTCSNTYEWCRNGIASHINSLQNFALTGIQNLVLSHKQGHKIYHPDISALSPEDGVRKTLEAQGVKSVLSVPLMDEKECIGFVGFDAILSHHEFSEKEQALLDLFAMMIVSVIKRSSIQKELIDARKKAEEANKAKSQFLANMSHEIRTPLNGVIGFTELLKKTPLNKVQQQYVDSANSSGLSLLGILNDILDFSKIEAGMLQLEILRTDIIELLENSIDIIKYTAGKKNIEVLLNVSRDFPRYADVDPIRLKQILANLLGNAVKFTESGEIELSASCAHLPDGTGEFYIAVRDTGIGISEKQKQKLFIAFSQADSSTTRTYGGTGLGLVISNMIAQKMNTSIQVDSVFGKGSVFSFTFKTPCEDGEKREMKPLSNITRCLLIDDNVNNILILEKMLEEWNIPAVSCASGYDALELFEKDQNFSAVICDYHMPGMDGLDTVRLMQEKLKKKQKALPIIFLHSSSDDGTLHQRCEELGISHLLIKPVRSAELFQCLAAIQRGEVSVLNKTPALEAETDGSASPSSAHILPNTRTILAAEDIDANMNLLKSMLSTMYSNIVMYEAKNGLEAVEKHARYKPDIILMDIQMPELDGIEAARRIRGQEKTLNFSSIIMAVSAGALKEEREKCFAAGMDDFLTKPINMKKLQQALDSAFEKLDERKQEADEKQIQAGGTEKISELKLLIERNKIISEEIIESAENELSAKYGNAEAQRILTAVRNFDYTLALELLEKER